MKWCRLSWATLRCPVTLMSFRGLRSSDVKISLHSKFCFIHDSKQIPRLHGKIRKSLVDLVDLTPKFPHPGKNPKQWERWERWWYTPWVRKNTTSLDVSSWIGKYEPENYRGNVLCKKYRPIRTSRPLAWFVGLRIATRSDMVRPVFMQWNCSLIPLSLFCGSM